MSSIVVQLVVQAVTGGAVQALQGLAAAAAAAFSSGQIAQAADAYTRMSGQLGLATASASELAAVQGRLFDIAQQTRQGLEPTVALYSKLSGALRETGATTAELASVTQTVAQAMAVSFTEAGAADGAIQQLGQAFASGALRGDEFNSVNEAAPRLMQAVADSLGVTRGELRSLAEQGKLTSDVLAQALTGEQARQIAAEFQQLSPTIAQAMTVAGNALTQFVGQLDQSTGATASFAGAIIGAADRLPAIADVWSAEFGRLTADSDGFFAGFIGNLDLIGFAAGDVVADIGDSFSVLPSTLRVAFTAVYAAADIAWATIRTGAQVLAIDLQARWLEIKDRGVSAFGELAITVAGQLDALVAGIRDNAGLIGGVLSAISPTAGTGFAAAVSELDGYTEAQGRVASSVLNSLIGIDRQREALDQQRVAVAAAGLQQVTSAREAFDATVAERDAAIERSRAVRDGAQVIADSVSITRSATAAQGAAAESSTRLAAGQREAAAAARAHAAEMSGVQRAADAYQRVAARVADALATPAERAQQEYRGSLRVLEEYREALMTLGPVDPSTLASIDATAAGLERMRDQGVAANEQVAAAAQAAALESERYWGGFGDAWASIIGEGMVNDFKDTGDQVRQLLKRLLADMATQIAAQRLVIPILTQLGIPTGGMQAGTGPGLLQLLSGGGQGGLLGSIGNALGLGGTGGGGFLGNIASTVGGTVRSVLGSIIGIGGGTAAFAGGLGAIGTAGGAAGLGLAGLGGAGAGAGAFAGATAGGAAGLGLMGALSSIASVAGPIALAAAAINALAGGRLFGTSYQTNRSGMQLDIGADGASGYTFEEQSRRRALFQGTRRRTVRGELPDDAQQSIDDLFASIGQTVAAAAGALGIDVPPLITASFRRTVDNKGNVLSEVGSILGRQYNESFETFSRRIAAENVIATIDRALGGTAAAVAESIGDAAGQAFEGGAAAAGQYGEQLEGGITTMLKGATEAVQGEASRIAERWRADADLLADGAGMLLAAATDMRQGMGLLTDGTLTQVADLVEDMAREGEPLAGAYARLSAETQLYRMALDMMGRSTAEVGEALVRRASEISEAAGGLDRARALWDGYFAEFYSAAERAQRAVDEAARRRTAALDALGLDGGISNEEFRRAFESAADSLSAEQTVRYLEAAEAIRVFNAAVAQAAQAAGTGTVVDDGLSGRIASDVAAGATGLRGSAAEIGAAVEALRREGESAVEAYERLSAGGSMLTETLAMLGVAFEGSAAQFAAAAAGVSAEFGSLASEFFRSYFSEAEQQAQRAQIAQSNYAAAIAASGMAAEQLASREQIRAAVMQALAAGNTTLAEQLLRVASAFNQVEQAAGAAAAASAGLAAQAGDAKLGGDWDFGGRHATNQGASWYTRGAGNWMETAWGAPWTEGPRVQTGDGTGTGNGTASELERVREALRNWFRDLTTGPLSPLTPAQQYAESLREWQATAAAAQAGDIDAARRLQSLSDGLLRQAQSYLGPGAAYTQLFNQVRGVVGQVAGVVDAGGSQIRPIDGLGDSAGRAASSLERLASAAGMAPGSLVAGLTDTIGDAILGAGLRAQSVQLPGPRVVQLDRPAPGAQDLARTRPVSRPPVVAQSDQAVEADPTVTLLRQLIRAVEANGAKTEAAIKQRPLSQPTRHLMG